MKKPKNLIKASAYAAAAIALIGLVYFGTQIANDSSPSAVNSPTGSSNQKSSEQNESNKELIAYTGVKGETALKTLKDLNSTVVTKTSDFGEYVDTINDLKGGTDGKYWSFYVNGELASIGADSFISTGEERIEWKFVNLQ